MKRWERVALPLAGVLVFLGLWAFATRHATPGDVPGPRLTLLGLVEIARSGVLLRNVVASVFRVSFGFSLAVALGVPLGMLVGWRARAHLVLNPLVQALRPISPIAWLPVATLLLGSGDSAAVFLIFLSSFFPIVVATAAAVRAIEPRYLRAAENFAVGRAVFVTRVMLPAALPQIVTGLRVALGIAWVVVVAAEMLGVRSGLGYQVNDARNSLRFDYVVAAMVVIGAIGYALDSTLRQLERRLAPRGRA
jgi:NitT/TauT family transport system permease protein